MSSIWASLEIVQYDRRGGGVASIGYVWLDVTWRPNKLEGLTPYKMYGSAPGLQAAMTETVPVARYPDFTSPGH